MAPSRMFLFYKKMYGLNWMTIAQGRIAEKPCWDFILINSRMDSRFYKEYKSVKAFTLHKAELKVKPTNWTTPGSGLTEFKDIDRKVGWWK